MKRAILMIMILGLAFAGGCPKGEQPMNDDQKPPEAAPGAAVRPPDDMPVQMPADPAALGALMDEMKAAADQVIEQVVAERRKGGAAEELFKKGFKKIHEVMRPEFGPANAWLFNERGYKVSGLCKKMGLTPQRCEEIEQEELYGE